MKAVSSCSVDVVVTTAVLCSVENVAKVLGEIRRVLVPVSEIKATFTYIDI
jgi:ubiquinone/menaquinone biosynthesis C-methylase UbiE